MTKKIFLTELLASCMVLVLVIGLIFGILIDVFEKELTDELSTEAHFIAATAEEYGGAAFIHLTNRTGASRSSAVTAMLFSIRKQTRPQWKITLTAKR